MIMITGGTCVCSLSCMEEMNDLHKASQCI